MYFKSSLYYLTRANAIGECLVMSCYILFVEGTVHVLHTCVCSEYTCLLKAVMESGDIVLLSVLELKLEWSEWVDSIYGIKRT